MKKRWGLAAVSTFWTTGAVVAAMAFDAINEHLRRGSPMGALVTEHLPHILLLLSAIYFLLWISFDLALASPLRKIAAGLDRLGSGSLEPVTLASRVREIDGVARAVNRMVDRLRLNFPHPTVDAVQADVSALRAIARSLPPLAERQAKRIMGVAADLELELAALAHAEALVATEARAVQQRADAERR